MRTLLAVVLTLLFIGVSAQQWYPCDAMPEYRTLTLDNALLEVRNLTTIMFPRNKYTGEIIRSSYASLTILSLQEWDTPYPNDCREPGHYNTSIGGQDGTSIVGTLFLPANMTCSIRSINDTLFGSLAVETVIVNFKHPNHPDFLGTLNVTRPSSAYELVYEGTNNTRFNDYRVRYIPDHFKITLQIDNWPWNSTTNNTHLVVLVNGDASMPVNSIINVVEQTNVTTFDMTSTNPSLSLAFTQSFDRGFLLDGMPYMNNMSHAGYSDIPWPAGVAFSQPFAFGFCQYFPPGFHPETIYWDPQLSILFNVQAPEASPKQKRTWLAILLGTLFGVLGLILIIVLVFIFVPGAQKVFTPFRNTSNSAAAQKAVSQRWNTTINKPASKTPGAVAEHADE